MPECDEEGSLYTVEKLKKNKKNMHYLFYNQNAEIFSHFYSFATFIRCLRLCCLLQAGRNTVGLIMDMYVSANTIFKLVSKTVNTHKNTQNAKHKT